MNGGQLGRICRAIDELAAASASADRPAGEPAPAAGEGGATQAGPARPGGATDRAERDDADIARLAAIWGMVADADPELAKRLPGYLSAAE